MEQEDGVASSRKLRDADEFTPRSLVRVSFHEETNSIIPVPALVSGPVTPTLASHLAHVFSLVGSPQSGVWRPPRVLLTSSTVQERRMTVFPNFLCQQPRATDLFDGAIPLSLPAGNPLSSVFGPETS